jgi:hypothetical protein
MIFLVGCHLGMHTMWYCLAGIIGELLQIFAFDRSDGSVCFKHKKSVSDHRATAP